jgi:NodT family efflux transporter outer membrane factor (OMF) lipoprotein
MEQWWTVFHSKPLNALVQASFEHNPRIDSARAALEAAQENVAVQKAALMPFAAASAAPTHQQVAKILTPILASNHYVYALYTGQLFITYTLDVFGGIRRQIESATALAEFQRLQLEATYLTLASNVVLTAIQEASLRAQIKTTQDIIALQTKVLHITQTKQSLGESSNNDIALEQASLATLEATIPRLEKQLAQQRDLLHTLVGGVPDDQHLPQFSLNALHLPTRLPISMPSELLEHRPDIRAAEETMRSANALVGVATANRLPSFVINSTNAGVSGTSIETLLNSQTRFWSLAGIITEPIYDAGALRSKQRQAQAVYRQAVAEYKKTIINAFQEVADTLYAIEYDAKGLQAADKAERAANTSLQIARKQLQMGDNNFVLWLLSEQNYNQAKLNLIQAQTNRLLDTVALFQALGGGWWHQAPKTEEKPWALRL